ncbi:Aste57867_18845 [Aphanomyces stellatus]|uniref:Aste57867_18845 protein n=1 Tax=Aphanomyces stellatus TaxID=120398 RepID=A0A485LCM3_9STRA|nr:hypothetical protein As57867_018781 [Aphanomyces stellatus]VFT95579.1 Aste57867_18845 [Aphanomyces stellatus]
MPRQAHAHRFHHLVVPSDARQNAAASQRGLTLETKKGGRVQLHRFHDVVASSTEARDDACVTEDLTRLASEAANVQAKYGGSVPAA